MAKKIEVIQCPQCKSVKKVNLTEDLFLCSSCGTEYFSDNEGIHVHINHNKTQKTERFFTKHKTPILVGVFLFVVLIIVLPSFFAPSSNNSFEVETSKRPEYREQIEKVFSVPQADIENPIALMITSKRYNDDRKEAFFARFYDILEDRFFPEIPISYEGSNAPVLETFASGKNYLVFLNDQFIYEVDFARQEFKNVTDQVLGGVPEFSSGITSVRFTSEAHGFEVSTNNGEALLYYPEIDQLFKSRSEMRKAQSQNRLKATTKKVSYLFTETSTDFPEEKIQLLKYWYPESYPKKVRWDLKWEYRLDKPTNTYKKSLFYGDIKFKDLTPDRLYFDQKIVYQDSENLYITGKASANSNAKPYLQRINTENGEVEWNFTIENPDNENRRARNNGFQKYGIQAYKNGLIVIYLDHSKGKPQKILNVFNKNGEVLKELNLDTMF